MKKHAIFCLLYLISGFLHLTAQTQFITRNGKATFFSRAPLENIEASNQQVLSILDTQKGEIAVSMLMKAFKFEKALMEEHFNENYVESAKYPKASFKGVIKNLNAINFTKDGKYTANVQGEINIHGKSKLITTTGTVTIKEHKITIDSKFNLTVKDFEIKIPKLLIDNIAETVEVTLHLAYEPHKP
ncbi:MAG: YceI family protein [Microscillaceae bacterium]|nr:YceI family protein [Microscillaceae bacterium]